MVAGIKGLPIEEVAATVTANTKKVFWPAERTASADSTK